MYKLILLYGIGTIILLSMSVAHPVPEALIESNVTKNRTRRQIFTADVGNCGGNHSNVVGGRVKRQIFTADVLNCGGEHSNTLGRQKRALQTDPNNIRFVVGNTQLFPLPANGNGNTGGSFQNVAPALPVQPSPSRNQLSTGDSSSDSGNTGGTHQNNIAIGGIQNFGGRYNDLVTKLTGDTNNHGGIHSNNIAIGGILNFP